MSGIVWVSVEQLRAKEVVWGLNGWRVYSLPGVIQSKEEFFRALKSMVPLEPELLSNHSWDALRDSLFEGLFLSRDEVVGITVCFSDPLPNELMPAMQTLAELPGALMDPEATGGPVKKVMVVCARSRIE